MNFFKRLLGKETPPSPPASPFQAFLDQCVAELTAKAEVHDGTWHLGECSWSVDQDSGIIEFAHPEGMVASCPVQIIGTYNSADGTWLWGWEHPSVVAPLQEHAFAVRQYGEENGIELLTTQKLECSQEQAWEFTALACKLGEAQGAYRGPAGSAFVFMTFGTVTLSKPQAH
ncbi:MULTISPECIES: DUF6882 domain-containing protein [unclassified Pseudomonas]|uniref:DUF6882 domain-containing protein n=1 Tax=unclassified Pseudomonas TaxID=196821 RepID=UPI001CE0BE5B|nr:MULTISPECIES: DUF6882 domain-containing protein [unclassified Pseudomonas]